MKLPSRIDFSKIYTFHFKLGKLKVLLSQNSLRKLSRLAKTNFPNETGGTLLGHYTNSMKIAVITEITRSKKNAKTSPVSFIRPSDHGESIENKKIIRAKGKLFYLGEWHSHPNGNPHPSTNDLRSLMFLAVHPNVPADTPIMLIIGNDLSINTKNLTCSMAEKNGICEISNPDLRKEK
jgi:[CysO sulfur-carrier protein]-S-L-cysteine hydrolase